MATFVHTPTVSVAVPVRENASTGENSRRWATLAVVGLAIFADTLNSAAVSLALPRIARDLDSSFAGLQWVLTITTLVFAALVLTMAKLGDLFGRKRLFLIGLAILAAASLACALAGSVTALIVARAVQGVGIALVSTMAGASLAASFAPEERALPFGIYGGLIGIAIVLGPIAGGVLANLVSWQAIFFLPVPMEVVAFVLGVVVIRESADRPARHAIDGAGAILSGVTLFALTFALTQGSTWGWMSARTLGCFGVTVVGFVLFIAVEAWQTRQGREPMVDLALFRNPTFSAASFVTLVVNLAFSGLGFSLALLYQNVLHYDGPGIGLRFLPLMGGFIIVIPLVGAIANRIAPRVLYGVALTVFAAGLLLIARLGPTDDWRILILGLIVTGCGGAALQAQVVNTTISSAPRSHMGVATGISETTRQIGLGVGTALLSTVFAARYNHYLPGALTDTGVSSETAHQLLTSGGVSVAGRVPTSVPPMIAGAIQTAMHRAFVSGFDDMVHVAAGFVVVALIVAVCCIRRQGTMRESGDIPR